MSPSTVRMDGRPGPHHSGPPCGRRPRAEGRGPGVRRVTAARTPWPLLAHPSSLPPSLSLPLSTCRVPRGLGIVACWCETVYAAGVEGLRSSGPLAQRGELGTGLGARCLCRARPGWSLKELQERRGVLGSVV